MAEPHPADGVSLSNIQGIVLDAVGTLIEAQPSVATVYAAAAAEQGVALDVATVKARFVQHFRYDEDRERLGPLVTSEARERARWRRLVGQVLPEVPDVDRAFEELWEHFARPDAWRVFPDVAPALRRLKDAGLGLAVGSNFDARLRRVITGLPELHALAPRLAISSEIGVRKPHPQFYETAARILELPPGGVLFIGDDPENDQAAPRRLGMPALRIDRTPGAFLPPDAFPDFLAVAAYLVGESGSLQQAPP